MLKTLATLTFSTSLLAACQSAPAPAPQPRPQTGPLDGDWLVTAYECPTGKLTRLGNEGNDRLLKDQDRYHYQFAGNEARIRLRTPSCTHDFTQTWLFNGRSIAVTDGTHDDVKSVDGSECKPYAAAPQRTHDYEQVGNLLRVRLSNDYAVTTDGKSERLCTAGRDVIVFSKLTR